MIKVISKQKYEKIVSYKNKYTSLEYDNECLKKTIESYEQQQEKIIDCLCSIIDDLKGTTAKTKIIASVKGILKIMGAKY